MSNLKMGKKDGPRNAAERFKKITNQPVSKRIVDFLKEEGRKERANEKKIAGPSGRQKDMEV